MKRIFKYTINIFATLILILSFMSCALALQTKGNQEVPSIRGYIPLIIQSDSMKGIFEKHDLIIDRKYRQSQELQVGDIITFYTFINGRRVLNTHAIYRIHDNAESLSYQTKGFHNNDVDESEVLPSDIVGVYCFRIPLIGKLIAFMQTKFGFFLCILFPLGLVFLVQLIYTIVQYSVLSKDRSVKQMEEEYQIKIQQLQLQIDELKKDKESR